MDFKHLIGLIFLMVLIPACLADPRDICPPKDLTTPCICRNHFEDGRAIVTCEKITGKDVILNVLNKTSDYGYGYFMIDLSTLTYMPATAFDIKKLVRLIIMDTTMVSLFDKTPNATDLEGFTAYRLKLTRAIQWDLFTGTPNLKNLTIEGSPLKSIDDKFLQYAPKSLVRITISNCSISKIHEEAFANMNNLIDIVMDEGKVKTLARSMFPTPARIQKFSFKNQRIESLPEDLFTEMPYLVHIWLTGNLIAQVSENTFKAPFEILRSCLLDKNPIKCDCSIRWIALITDREGSFWRGNLLGRCEEPKNLHGVELTDLTQNHFQHCEGSSNLKDMSLNSIVPHHF